MYSKYNYLFNAVSCCRKNAEEQTTKYCKECPLYSHGDKCLEKRDELTAEVLKEYEGVATELEHLKLILKAYVELYETAVNKFGTLLTELGKG